MPCPDFLDLLSAYHDGELASDREEAVAVHVASCPHCAAELESFRNLSELTIQLEDYPPPRKVWRSIEMQLDTQIADGVKPFSGHSRLVSRRKLLMLTLLLTFGVSMVLYVVFHTHEHLAINLGPFIDVFERSPNEAQMQLVAKYPGRRVDLIEAVNELKYRPVAADGLPLDYELLEANLLQMPCCRCLEVCYQRKGGGMLCLFEHERDQFVQFGDRHVSSMVCGGRSTRVVQMNGPLTATWQQNGRYITIVGADDIVEVSRLVLHFEQTGTAVRL